MTQTAISMRELLDAGVHFGHQTRRWHPHMKPFLYGERNGIHIINLQYTLPRFRQAAEFLTEVVASGGMVLFVATKRQAQEIVSEQARACGMPFVHRRWLGGMLTNFRTIRRGIDRYKELNEVLGDEENTAGLSKKERSKRVREQLKLHKAFEGLIDIERPPDCLFVIDIRREHLAIKEAQRLQLPIVAIVDSNCDPDGIDYPVPGNDDAMRAIRLYCEKAAQACRLGAELHNQRIVEEGHAAAQEESVDVAAAPVGKRVVEITQPVRRPARLEREAKRQREELAAEEKAASQAAVAESPVEAPGESPPPPTGETPQASSHSTDGEGATAAAPSSGAESAAPHAEETNPETGRN